MMMLVFLFAAVAFLAWSNGANDNFKGVAALYGSGIASYWKALAWATVTTGAGSVAALFLAAELLHKFSGKGLVPEALTASPAFLLAVALGGGCTVLLATRLGFPVSTTHAITGALVGAGLTAAPDAVNFARLWEGFAKPLLLSPLVAVGTGALLFVILRALRLAPAHRFPAQAEDAVVTIHADQPGAVIAPEIHGQFVEHVSNGVYPGLWVGPESPIPNTRGFRNDVVEALRRIHVPLIRWPGGCFADTYNWRDGVGPREQRPVRPNNNWAVTESNQVGTDEFFDLAQQIGARTYLNINMGTGSPADMVDWLDYMTSHPGTTLADQRVTNGHAQPYTIDYLGLGNESWGCGGNMTPEFYADNYRRYNTFVKNYVPGPENRLYRIACGSSGRHGL